MNVSVRMGPPVTTSLESATVQLGGEEKLVMKVYLVALAEQSIHCCAACLEGYYGDGCQACMCQNGASCDHINGDCDCTAGWTGLHCDDGN